MDYMSERLQPKDNYVSAPPHVRRDKSNECIWEDEILMAKVENYLPKKYDYYRFCNRCMGSADEITRDKD